jgi:hypothetical protein
MVGGTRFTAGFTMRALVEMQEREKILSGEEKKRALVVRRVYVSLDRADAIIEGGRALIPKNAFGCHIPAGFRVRPLTSTPSF